jgi:type II secretory pathway pseudopilin PulG
VLVRRRQQGDTLIEVLFGVTIFSLILVGTIILMNQGSAAAQRALEISLVRQQIDGQAETLRYLHDAYVAAYTPGVIPDATTPAGQWVALVSDTSRVNNGAASSFGGTTTACPGASPRWFVMNPKEANYSTAGALFQTADTYAKVEQNTAGTLTAAKGIWVEGVASPVVNKVRYIDFHIRACWSSPGSNVPITLGTIVRLYDKEL